MAQDLVGGTVAVASDDLAQNCRGNQKPVMLSKGRSAFLLGVLAILTSCPRVGFAGGFTIGAMQVLWNLPPVTQPPIHTNCPSYYGCGYYYTNMSNPPIPSGGWHYFGGGTSYQAQTYINTVVPTYVKFNLNNTTPLNLSAFVGLGNCTPDQVCGNFPSDYRAPSGDGGYVLWASANTTSHSTNAPFISLGPSTTNPCSSSREANCFYHFYMYWGSVDYWNTVTFTDVWNNTYTVTGLDFSNDGLPVDNGNNTNSVTVDFSVTYTDSHHRHWPVPLQSVQFQACGPSVGGSPACAPSFEFDNIEWTTCGTLCYSGPDPFAMVPIGASAVAQLGTPEPASWLLLCSGLGTLTGIIKRRRVCQRRKP